MTVPSAAISKVDIAETLSKIRSLSNMTKSVGSTALSPLKANQFSELLSVAKSSLSAINTNQVQTEALKSAYLTGNSSVSASDVMLSTMQSKIAFQGLIVVRNKLLEAYKEIMNMPV